jgi:SAM-dependent methyltransferase
MADWSQGDYAHTARRLEPMAHALVDAVAVGRGDRVLDVGAGDGNVALAAAAAGAQVSALDITPKLVEEGRARTAGLAVEWIVGDAQDLPFDDDGFDVALSNFAVIFAEDQGRAAAELRRVARRIGITAWTHNSFFSRFGRELGVRGEMPNADTWADAHVLRRRLGADVHIQQHEVTWTFVDTDGLLAYAQTNPVFAAAPPHVAGALADFAAREARRPDGSIGVVLEYVLATTPPG